MRRYWRCTIAVPAKKELWKRICVLLALDQADDTNWADFHPTKPPVHPVIELAQGTSYVENAMTSEETSRHRDFKVDAVVYMIFTWGESSDFSGKLTCFNRHYRLP
jgi:hypothetical protein